MLKNLSKKPPEPSSEEVKKYLNQRKTDEVLSYSEKSLNNLFRVFSLNNNLDEIIVKVCTLDVIFSANASRWFFEVSKHILNYDFDNKFKNKEFDVNKFALIKVKDIKNNKTKERNFYSFATKYCNHHNPLEYPIYDFYVDEILWYFMEEELNQKRSNLKKYPTFKETIIKFKKKFKLEEFNLKEIDKYIWLLGKEFFKH